MAQKPHQDRRKGDDWLIKLLRISSIVSWLGFTAFLFLFHFARPERNTGLVRYHSLEIRSYWDQRLSDPALYVIWGCALLSLVTIVLNTKRNRRSDDLKGYNMLLLLVISLFSASLLTAILRS